MYINRLKSNLFVLIAVCIVQFSCKDKEATDLTEPFGFVKPAGFPETTYTFENNPITLEKFELGRKLFFDPNLSIDGSVSCNNCHQQSVAFADNAQHPFSIGIDEQAGIRNAPSLFNLAFRKEFFWDGGVTHLDFVPINALESSIEMGETLPNIVKKLNADSEYLKLFKSAFEVDEVTSPLMLQALSQYLLMMISNNSKYDHYISGQKNATFSAIEKKGLELFESKCASCHQGILFTDQSFRNNGINETFSDLGRALITEVEEDEGKFFVPSLRNVAQTAPYMHDASFESLEAVLDHYANGVVSSKSLDPIFKENDKLGIPMTEEEQESIIAFLKTLTDYEFLNDTKFNQVR